MSVNIITDKADLVVVKTVVAADATAGKAVVIPCTFDLVDVIVQCNGANANGTMTVKRNGTSITDAIICAVNHVVTRVGTIDDAQSTILATDAVTVVAAQAGDLGTIYLIGYRLG